MKLSKVQAVLDSFNINNMDDYDIKSLDLNRVPNPSDDYDKKEPCKVTMLVAEGQRIPLVPGEITRYEAERDDLKAIEIRYTGHNPRKILLIN